LGFRIPLIALVQALAVADHLNFRRAAEALGTSQSAVSQRIKMLEENLGVNLFERHHRGVRLTQAGRSFLQEVSQGLEHLEYAVKSVGMMIRGEQGHLGIGLYSPIADGFLADLLNAYRERYPQVDIEIAEGRAHDLIRHVREERLDISFVLGTPTIADCQCKPLWTETLVVALPAQHPLTQAKAVHWADLAAETFIVRNDGIGPQIYDHIVLRLTEHWLRPSVRHFDVGRDTIMSMVAQGHGLALTTEPAPGSCSQTWCSVPLSTNPNRSSSVPSGRRLTETNPCGTSSISPSANHGAPARPTRRGY
jgi:DNA-binding transcriptional LysR family regulator